MATRTERQMDIPVADKAAQSGAAPQGAVERALSAAATPLPPAPAREESVRLLAYTYYEERGRVDGYALDDWLKAEATLNSVNADT
jgi:hypothetical protein